MLSTLSGISSGLRRTDGSIVEGTTGNLPTTVNNQSFIRRPSINNINMGPNFRQEGDMGRYVAFNDPGQPGAGFSNYQDYLNAGNPAVKGPMVGTLGGAMIPEQRPLGPGLVGGTTPQTGINTPGSLTLTGMAQQPVQQPIQQPMQNPFGGGLSSLNQQPFGGGLSFLNQQPFAMNQQPQQMNGGLKGLLDSYIVNYINNYFMNALK